MSEVVTALVVALVLLTTSGGCGDTGSGSTGTSDQPSRGVTELDRGGDTAAAAGPRAAVVDGGRGVADPPAASSGNADRPAPTEEAGSPSWNEPGDSRDAGRDAGDDAAAELTDAAMEAPPRGPADELLTHRYDNARTGANLAERKLTAANASTLKFLGDWPVDGQIYAQVLVANEVEVAGAKRSLAIVATMNNSVYAFDADAERISGPLWHQGGNGELGMPMSCSRNINGPYGILSTPVIDPAKQSLYLVARDCDPNFPPEAPRCEHRLFQLDLATGGILRKITISGAVSVESGGSSTPVRFDPSAHWNRPALLLTGDQLVIAFGAGPAGNQHEEDFVYHGWVFRYDVRDLERVPDVYCTTPRGRGGSVWQAGSGPAADAMGIYLTGANGIQSDNVVHPPEEWPGAPLGQEDSVVRLPLAARFPTPNDSVAQYTDLRDYAAAGNVFQHMESGDNGFGSSGVLLLPDSDGLLVGTKAGLVYLLDRATMRSLQDPISPFTRLPLQPGHTLYLHGWSGIPVITQFAFWRPSSADDGTRYGFAYAWASEDVLKSFRYDYERGTLEPFAAADVPVIKGGGNLVLSALGDARETGVLWVATRSSTRAAPAGRLWAFDPITLEVLLSLETPAWAKFNPPTVAHGRVFLPSTAADNPDAQRVLVYGLP